MSSLRLALTCTAAAILLVCFPAAGPAAPQAAGDLSSGLLRQNLLPNPDFEFGTVHWRLWAAGSR